MLNVVEAQKDVECRRNTYIEIISSAISIAGLWASSLDLSLFISSRAIIDHCTRRRRFSEDSFRNKSRISLVTSSQFRRTPTKFCWRLSGNWIFELSSRRPSRHRDSDDSSRDTASMSFRASRKSETNVTICLDKATMFDIREAQATAMARATGSGILLNQCRLAELSTRDCDGLPSH